MSFTPFFLQSEKNYRQAARWRQWYSKNPERCRLQQRESRRRSIQRIQENYGVCRKCIGCGSLLPLRRLVEAFRFYRDLDGNPLRGPAARDMVHGSLLHIRYICLDCIALPVFDPPEQPNLKWHHDELSDLAVSLEEDDDPQGVAFRYIVEGRANLFYHGLPQLNDPGRTCENQNAWENVTTGTPGDRFGQSTLRRPKSA